jgi:hypothetical protein
MVIIEKKIQEAKDELKEWLEKPNRKEQNYFRHLNEIEEELKEVKIQKSIRLPFEYLDNWFSNNFVYELLCNGITEYKTAAINNEIYNLLIADKLSDQYPKRPPVLAFDRIGYWLANCLSQRRYAESETLLKIINKGLNSNFINGGEHYKSSTWFIIEIANKGYNIHTDYSKYNYPENMGVYQEALDNWNTNDLILLDNIVSKLCDYHLENATYGDDENSMKIQFGQDNWFVYTFEILAWLSIREMIGLRNSEKFNHPLMNLELNKLTNEPTSFPKNELGELFERVMKR